MGRATLGSYMGRATEGADRQGSRGLRWVGLQGLARQSYRGLAGQGYRKG